MPLDVRSRLNRVPRSVTSPSRLNSRNKVNLSESNVAILSPQFNTIRPKSTAMLVGVLESTSSNYLDL